MSSPAENLNKVFDYVAKNKDHYISELREAVGIPRCILVQCLLALYCDQGEFDSRSLILFYCYLSFV